MESFLTLNFRILAPIRHSIILLANSNNFKISENDLEPSNIPKKKFHVQVQSLHVEKSRLIWIRNSHLFDSVWKLTSYWRFMDTDRKWKLVEFDDACTMYMTWCVEHIFNISCYRHAFSFTWHLTIAGGWWFVSRQWHLCHLVPVNSVIYFCFYDRIHHTVGKIFGFFLFTADMIQFHCFIGVD